MKETLKKQQHARRAHRDHVKMKHSKRPRLIVFRSLKAIYAQVMDNQSGKILFSASTLKGKNNIEGAKNVGTEIAQLAKAKKIKALVFDKNGYAYKGKVQAVADSVRAAGMVI